MIDELHAVLARPLLKLAFQSRVIMVLDVIIGPAFEVFCNLRPAVTIDLVVFKDFVILFRRPFYLLDVRVQVVVPSKSNLISSNIW